MYEHRLYSKDIRGFLLTGNSTASFFLLAAFAALDCALRRSVSGNTPRHWRHWSVTGWHFYLPPAD